MINELKAQLEKNRGAVDAWFAEKARGVIEPVYASVDVRNSHHKIAVVDTNAFPAGFNNLCPFYCHGLAAAFGEHLSRFYPAARRILVFPEFHTRNKYYVENLRRIMIALQEAGFEARAGTAEPEAPERTVAQAAEEGEVVIERLQRNGGAVSLPGFAPDLILSNNDFSAGVPEVLHGLSIPVVPPPGLGWHRRRKYDHFLILNRLIAEFAPVAGIDPWTISTRVARVMDMDFNDEGSRERLAEEVDRLLAGIREDDARHGEGAEPYVFIKNNAGTYGIAVMTARSGDEVRNASHKTRTKMSTAKGRRPVTEVIVQEGIRTMDSMDGFPMEPVIYMVGPRAVGGFYRLHRKRNDFENLNIAGMEFKKLCFHEVAGHHPEHLDDQCEAEPDLLYSYGTLARLAVLALGEEMKNLREEP
jgi:glutamate--cysteine ligase